MSRQLEQHIQLVAVHVHVLVQQQCCLHWCGHIRCGAVARAARQQRQQQHTGGAACDGPFSLNAPGTHCHRMSVVDRCTAQAPMPNCCAVYERRATKCSKCGKPWAIGRLGAAPTAGCTAHGPQRLPPWPCVALLVLLPQFTVPGHLRSGLCRCLFQGSRCRSCPQARRRSRAAQGLLPPLLLLTPRAALGGR